VDGVVYGSDGKPLAKANVGVGSDRVASNVIPSIKTDDKGHFAFGAKPGAQVVVTVKAQKHAPELKEFLMGEKPEHLDIHLTAGNTIEGKSSMPMASRSRACRFTRIPGAAIARSTHA
jgi:hypothetical protein